MRPPASCALENLATRKQQQQQPPPPLLSPSPNPANPGRDLPCSMATAPPPPDPAGDPEVLRPDPTTQGREDVQHSRLAPDGVTNTTEISQQDAIKRRQNILKLFVSEYLGIPLKEPLVTYDTYPAVGMAKGFLSYFANAPKLALLPSEKEEPSKFSEWLKNNVDPDNVYIKKIIRMISELNSFGISPVSHSMAPATARLYPSFKALFQSLKPIQRQTSNVKQSIPQVEMPSEEGVKALGYIKDTASKVSTLVNDAVKALEYAEKKGALEEGQSIFKKAMQGLKKLEDHEISEALKHVDNLSQLADIPVSVKKRLDEMSKQVKLLKATVSAITTGLGYSAILNQPNESAGKPVSAGKPETGTPKLVPVAMAPVIPFHKVGKIAKDVLYKDFLGEAPYLNEMYCQFGKDLNHSLTVKASAEPDAVAILNPLALWGSTLKGEVRAVLKHEELWGSKLKGNLRFVLPFQNLVDANGAQVPLKKTSMGELLYYHERACLSGTVGLQANPPISLGGMIGTTAPLFGASTLSAGGRLTFSSANGAVTGFETALSFTNPEWGTVSAVANMIDNQRGVKVYYNQKVLNQNTIAAELDYNHQTHSVVVSAGLAHQYDRSVLMKAVIKSDGVAQGMVETKEGIAGSTVRACVKVNLNHLEQVPRVGFSISTNPTWG